MARKVLDCRDFPGPCALVLAGTEAEIFDAGIPHAVEVHQQEDGAALRELLRSSLHDEGEWLRAQVLAEGRTA